MTFVLEAVRVRGGSALLLHFGPPGETPDRILIDCGADGSYQACLSPRLEQLRGPAKDLELRMVLVTQTDIGHLSEIACLLREVATGRAPVRPDALWFNSSPQEGAPHAQEILQMAKELNLDLNPPFDPPEIKANPKPIALGHGVSIEALAPYETPTTLAEAAPIILVRKGDQSVLISGNASSTRIANSLALAGYLDEAEAYPETEGREPGSAIPKPVEDPFHVSLMVITQHGPASRMTPDFFRRVTADSYLFAGNTLDGNPDETMLHAIAKARGDDEFNIYFTITANDEGACPAKRAILDWVARDMPDGCVAIFRDDPPNRRVTAVELPA